MKNFSKIAFMNTLTGQKVVKSNKKLKPVESDQLKFNQLIKKLHK